MNSDSLTIFAVLCSHIRGERMKDCLLLLQGMLWDLAEAGVLRPQPDHGLFSPAQMQFRKHTAAP